MICVRIGVVLGSNALAVVAYLLFALTDLHPLVSIVMLGIHFSLMPACVWPLVSLLVEKDLQGTAYAIVSSLMNAALTGMFPLSGYIGKYNQHTLLTLLFLSSSLAFFNHFLFLHFIVLFFFSVVNEIGCCV